ncbi:MAG: CDP-diacylglycerol--glycerol-3-phosphate 3-phosphatidyltransferase [Candidatus Muproteobacteria bacterium RIFCSPHIGHO2_01_FULL_65_16]|uniref:CDP-diacylglycerol--glycerol-3-phosphate 3-phosphatidyltransferase n=1 Tax=Candidatus Muproteobacteria bacterium RIFCSPHIGHO2_01_FULL_65_16 TaxID=1817764 RepID=A0A1F6TI65_9PROT|nr:MAG: CDP-diacylglycerol--glycerol-3-phosphate 3-phosphatidyltransferase [Candidatus Muproteobacteria bacterium RIFCSPHIGHO2_01_FULL_65_16]
MPLNAPNALTLLRIALIPLFVVIYALAEPWALKLATALFVLAGITDWLDGYLARRLQQFSPFGAFLDPVADKLMVAAALVMLLSDPQVLARVLDMRLFALVVLVILGREIAVSALREWMAGLGRREHVAVSVVGKVKTGSQMVAIPFLIWREPLWGLPTFKTGEVLLYIAAGLTLWSMVAYLKIAWPNLVNPGAGTRP